MYVFPNSNPAIGAKVAWYMPAQVTSTKAIMRPYIPCNGAWGLGFRDSKQNPQQIPRTRQGGIVSFQGGDQTSLATPSGAALIRNIP